MEPIRVNRSKPESQLGISLSELSQNGSNSWLLWPASDRSVVLCSAQSDAVWAQIVVCEINYLWQSEQTYSVHILSCCRQSYFQTWVGRSIVCCLSQSLAVGNMYKLPSYVLALSPQPACCGPRSLASSTFLDITIWHTRQALIF